MINRLLMKRLKIGKNMPAHENVIEVRFNNIVFSVKYEAYD